MSSTIKLLIAYPVNKEKQIAMTNDEKFIKEHVGNRTPFKVPKGYFEQLVPQVMSQLPEYPDRTLKLENEATEAKVIPLFEKIRPILYIAATLFIAVLTFSVYMQTMNKEAKQQLAVQEEINDDYFDEGADYVMLDNYDIYACLTSE